MTQPGSGDNEGADGEQHVMVVGPDGRPVGMARVPQPPGQDGDADQEQHGVGAMVEQPAKVMRIGTMIKQLLEEVRSAPLDDASRVRLRSILSSSVRELEEGLAPELRDELNRLSTPFADDTTPSDAELRIGQACALLVNSQRPIAHTADEVGYANLANFNRQFRALKGMTPREFRRTFAREGSGAALAEVKSGV